MSKNKGFTLVELLAVIVILAVILVIAVPQIMNTITESRKGALISSAKLIASSAETAYISNQTLGIEKNIECRDISNYTDEDYKSCDITFVDGKAKVTLIGQGKFEGMAVCSGTKENAEVEEPINGKCPTQFEKDNWATIAEAVRVGDTEKYNVGDTKEIFLGETLGTHTVRIANKSTPAECEQIGFSQTACGFVIEFADIITNHYMDLTDTNVGGWPASEMYAYLNVVDGVKNSGTIYNALVSAIGDVIIDTKVVSGHGSTSGEENFTTTDKVYLLSTREVWGKEGTGTKIYYDSADGDTITRQLDWYKDNGVTTASRSNAIKKNGTSASNWWLRSVFSDSTRYFYAVSYSGDFNSAITYDNNGVSPAFRLG